jgi:hypothetical protein
MSSRRERGLNQNLFLVETKPVNDQYTREYAIMGTTGNVYNVTISETTKCTCPDYLTRFNTCKHIYFVLLKVMKTSGRGRQNYTKSALLKMFENIPSITSRLIVNQELKNFYKQATGESQMEETEGIVKQQEINDICPICLEDLTDGNQIDYCKYSCGKNIHTNCFNMWGIKNDRICPFCRNNWEKNPKENYISSGYVNLYEGVGQEDEDEDIDEIQIVRNTTNSNLRTNNVEKNDSNEEDFTKYVEEIEKVYENLNKNNLSTNEQHKMKIIETSSVKMKLNNNLVLEELVIKPKARNAYMIFCSQMRNEIIDKEKLSGKAINFSSW